MNTSNSSPDPQLQVQLETLVEWGFHSIPHSGSSLLHHLIGTYNLLQAAGCSRSICEAGLYHSAADHVPSASLLHCVGNETREIIERYETSRAARRPNQGLSGADKSVLPETADDIACISLANALEQLPRVPLNYRDRIARNISELLAALDCRSHGAALTRLISKSREMLESRLHNCPVQFVRAAKSVPVPERSDNTLGGSAPHRAILYCHPFATANAFGWIVRAPADIDVLWDGSDVLFRMAPSGEWRELDKYVHPEFADAFKADSPAELHCLAGVPLLAKAPEHGLIQVWTGLYATTQEGWSLLVRPLVNRPSSPSHQVFEGIIETDWWFGPLVFPIALQKRSIVRLRRRRPLVQVQPIRKECYSDSTLLERPPAVGFSELTELDWQNIRWALELPSRNAKPGAYRAEARRRAHERSP